MWRISMMISPKTSSATERVLEYGALKTGMPKRFAAFKSTWFVPMQKHPTAISFFADSSTSAVNFVRERMPTMCVSASSFFNCSPSRAVL